VEALRLNEYVTDKDINIPKEKISKFRNQKVEIIILPVNENVKPASFMDFVGELSNEEATEMMETLEECRKIDKGEW